ncbi:DNA-binding transcriptional LysR family regulator [Bradyrhizobium japonicum]|uniref:LysR family transcriptional regulator n=1 Tax=Bradyrhizobium elkanii TaxID=29448 RepID=UPI00036F47C2|nr:LysR family transcriptional regulator [Bradyrhizobium elkanii]MBP2435397.1 DNA-binding transcriptional LysR family regulator [Bradyrhizobium elkanii]MCP1737833.1 DNA-binding transcriptional LysR family regulator [Bradyrhizobium elkanii]MCS3575993.1 DNA-binding transcriptional LysR family regulator [Bradyrhizobium elkanii]MCS3594670.1 DNA-binding transcriptional LysR family regulator [Bradyrhizobium elkanii]MCS3625864.1 DNA-binding transcriptional LysR family regulator [Bradyrhizobium elkani
MALSLSRLRLFHELSELGTISAVARALGQTRPAVSQQLALLEREAGAVLFERSAGGLRLTTKGQQLLDRVTPLLQLAERIEAELDEKDGPPAGELRLAAFGSVATSIVPRALGYLHKTHPLIDAIFVELEPTEGLKATVAKQVDIAIVDDYADASAYQQALEFHPLYVDALSAILSSDHRFAKADLTSIELKDLSNEKWAINQTAVAYQQNLTNACLAAGFEMKIGCSARNISATLEMVRTGQFVTVLPGLAVQPLDKDPDFRVLPIAPALHRHIFSAVPKGTSRRPIVAAALAALERAALNCRL